MPFDLSFEKLIVIIGVSIIVFGPARTLEFARQAGKLIAELRQTWARFADDWSLVNLAAEPPAAPRPSRRCPACNAETREGHVYCGQCGAPFANDCPACGTRHVSDKLACANCGTALPAAARPIAARGRTWPVSDAPSG